MQAAVVRHFDFAPKYEEFQIQQPQGEDEVLVQVLAAGLHPRVRAGASGLHYADQRVLPMIPGIDAVGRLPDGQLVYCVVHDTPFGTLAEQVVADRRRCAPLPEGSNVSVIAASMNPAMSSWLALQHRAQIQPGQSVLVLGATGSSGQMALHIAKFLGAGRVVGAGRQLSRLEGSPADALVSLQGEARSVSQALAEAASEVDIVLDYLWGAPAANALVALLTARRERGRRMSWVQIGSVAGPDITLPSVAFRSTNLCMMGSGQGSVPVKSIVAELPRIAEVLASGKIPVNVRSVPLANVEQTWNAPTSAGERVVFVP